MAVNPEVNFGLPSFQGLIKQVNDDLNLLTWMMDNLHPARFAYLMVTVNSSLRRPDLLYRALNIALDNSMDSEMLGKIKTALESNNFDVSELDF